MTNRLTNPTQILRSIVETQRFLSKLPHGQQIGIVPTMGALHTGHLSLVDRAADECDVVIATIFVNPTQFAPHEDFSKYPRTLQRDLELLESHGCHAAFVPENRTMYPDGFTTSIVPPEVANVLEGEFRPTHFSGVCTVVMKLFNIIRGTDAYFGLKDYQQFAVLRQMVVDLNHPIRLHGCPTIREIDGLAMSSRNRYLSMEEHAIALGISKSLKNNQARFASGLTDISELESHLRNDLKTAGINDIHYATVRDAWTLQRIHTATASSIALIAAKVGSTRLIDNMPCGTSYP